MACRIRTLLKAALMLALPVMAGASSGWAAVQYLNEGAKQNAQGGWDLPTQGTCPADPAMTSRPDCLALRIVAASQTACTTANGSWTTSGVCNDLVNNADQAACAAHPDRLWNAGTGVCAIVMKDDDRNRVVCANHGGTWVTTGTCQGSWVYQNSSAYNPPLLTGTTNPGPGDQCLRCHNDVAQYNGVRIRDVNSILKQGHKNVTRLVTPGSALPWAGPARVCSDPAYTTRTDCEAHGATWQNGLGIYPADSGGNLFDWNLGQIGMGGVARDVYWIYGDWLSPLPRATAKLPASTSKVCSDPRYSTQTTCEGNGGSWIFNAGASYSCARCHTTGWTSDATVRTTKEPERTFPGITWDRNTDAPFGVVNLSGGISGDASKYASWDVWGVSCTRCHSSAVDNASNGGVPPFNAPAGMSSHHSNLTATDFPAACTVSGQRSASACATAGGTWNYGYCTDSRFLIGTSLAASKSSCETNGGQGEPAPGVGPGVWITPCSDNNFGSQAACEGAGASWSLATTSCDVAGVCNKGTCSVGAWANQDECVANGGAWTGLATQTTCEAVPGGQWAAATDVITCDDAGGRWTGSVTQRGPMIIALCMNCHRQESGGFPSDPNNPATALKVGPAHGSVEFLSHYHGNQFLNSPHGKFTGAFSQIATGKFAYDMSGEYKSFFQTRGEAAGTGNGCTGCHNVHRTVVEEANEPGVMHKEAVEECTACHGKNLDLVMHPHGTGTPLEEMDEEPSEACHTCHMPGGLHLFRINVDPSYSTFPTAALTGTTNANTAPSGTYANAVWVDLDHACGQCHGGGTATASTTGDIASGSKVLTVADTTGFAAEQRIKVEGAGGFTLGDDGLVNADFETYILSVSPPATINLAGAASATVSGKAVTQNPTKNGAPYMARTRLAQLAKGMHNDKPVATFGYTIGDSGGNTLIVNVDASASTCSGDIANCDAFEWEWGDGTTGTGVTASHTYADPNTYDVTLTVEEFGVGGGTASREVTVYQPDYRPVVSGVCTFDADTWTETVDDTSTDDNAVAQVTVNWGDGGMLSNDTVAPFGPFSRTYLNAGTYTITHKAIDTIGQQSTRTCTATPAYFTIDGTVLSLGGSPIGTATVVVKKGTTVVRTVYTASNGTFTVGNLKPATYTLTVTRSPYTFTVPAATIAVGPSSPGNTISATGPFMVNGGSGGTGGNSSRVQKP